MPLDQPPEQALRAKVVSGIAHAYAFAFAPDQHVAGKARLGSRRCYLAACILNGQDNSIIEHEEFRGSPAAESDATLRNEARLRLDSLSKGHDGYWTVSGVRAHTVVVVCHGIGTIMGNLVAHVAARRIVASLLLDEG
ncbi:MAG TPA: hypothetical protein VGB97_00625 [Candidatus Paceibacterota bacterium]|jgi:hypothetical protein